MEDGYKQTVFGLLQAQGIARGHRHDHGSLAAKQSALAAIEAAIRVFDPLHVPATEHQRRGAGTTGLYRFVMESLRKEGAVTTLGIATALIRERGWDHSATRFWRQMCASGLAMRCTRCESRGA